MNPRRRWYAALVKHIGSAIRARRLDAATGQPTGTTLELAPAAANQNSPQGILSGDRVLVLWDR